MKKIILSALFLSISTGGCPNSPVPPHPTPVIIDTEMCSVADTHLAQLCQADPVKNKYCCQVDALTKKGKNFTQFCTETQNDGVFLNPKCLSQVTSCDQIDACTQSKGK